jgi:hypothetical protein
MKPEIREKLNTILNNYWMEKDRPENTRRAIESIARLVRESVPKELTCFYCERDIDRCDHLGYNTCRKEMLETWGEG